MCYLNKNLLALTVEDKVKNVQAVFNMMSSWETEFTDIRERMQLSRFQSITSSKCQKTDCGQKTEENDNLPVTPERD
jgi:hypothetical protein